jgi:excinuclease UvrABC nuclease subunit
VKIKTIKIIKENLSKKNEKLLDDSIKNEAGIYFLFNHKKELIYIGQTKMLRQRLLIHLSPRTKGRKSFHTLNLNEDYYNTCLPLDSVKYYSLIPVDNKEEREVFEHILIFILKPKFNSKF